MKYSSLVICRVEQNMKQWLDAIKQALMPVAASRQKSVNEDQHISGLKRSELKYMNRRTYVGTTTFNVKRMKHYYP